MLTRIALVLFCTIFIPASAWAQSAEVINQAKKEGEVVLYTTMTVGDFQHFNKAAKEKYPFSQHPSRLPKLSAAKRPRHAGI